MRTPNRNVRVEDELWDRVHRAAALEEEDGGVSGVIRRLLLRYVVRIERKHGIED